LSIDLTNERDVVEDFIGEIPFNVLVLANYNFYTLVDEIRYAFNAKKSPTMSITLSVFLLLILFPLAQQILQDVNKTPLFLITYANNNQSSTTTTRLLTTYNPSEHRSSHSLYNIRSSIEHNNLL
jgi:hypothetical protein